MKIHFFCSTNITECLICSPLPLKKGGLTLTCKILITSFSACTGLDFSFVFFLAVQAKVGQDESNSKVAKIIFKEVSNYPAPPPFAQLLVAVPPVPGPAAATGTAMG